MKSHALAALAGAALALAGATAGGAFTGSTAPPAFGVIGSATSYTPTVPYLAQP